MPTASGDGLHIVRLGETSRWERFLGVARLHAQEVPKGFLTSLGQPFLARLFAFIAKDPGSGLLVAEKDETVVGFIAYSTDLGRLYKAFLLRQGCLCCLKILPRLLSFDRIKRTLETLFVPNRCGERGLPSSQILSFCVDATRQRQGIGRRLFAALAEELATTGVDKLLIITGCDQVSAQRFYDSLGALPMGGCCVHAGHPSVMYVYTLSRNEADGPMCGRDKG